MATSDAERGVRIEFERAISALGEGDLETSESICRAALGRFPDEGNLLCLLGTVLVRRRRPAEAEAVLRPVVAQYPEFAKAHEELGNALLAQRRLEEAADCLERTIQLDPSNDSARFKLGKVLDVVGGNRARNEPPQAEEETTEDALARAAALRGSGRLREAEGIYMDVIAREPGNAVAYQLLGELALKQRQLGDAIVFLRKAVELDPDAASAWLDLAEALGQKDELEEAIEAGRRACELQPHSTLPHLSVASLCSRAGRYEEAVAAYRAGLRSHPDDRRLTLGLGHTLRTVGAGDEAVRLYRGLIDRYPDFGEAYWSFANLKNVRFERSEVLAMEERLEKADGADVFFSFALGKAYEDECEYAKAFECFRRGNAAHRAAVSYDAVATQESTDRLIDVFDRALLDRGTRDRETSPVPIFIVGLPRSGSTLVEQILASHSEVQGTRELPVLERMILELDERGSGATFPESISRMSPDEHAALGAQYLMSTRRYRGDAPYFTDKALTNFRYAGLLELILPGAIVIDVRRHPLDSCLGSYKQLFTQGHPYTFDIFELGEYFLQYRRLMDHWHRVLPGRVLDVRYEHLVAEPEREIRRLLEHCGLEWEVSCLDFHETSRAIESASSEQVRRPIYDTSVDAWRHYESQLGELIDILRPVLDEG